MSAKKDNLAAAIAALDAEVGAEVAKEDLVAYVARCNEVIERVRAIKKVHSRQIAVIASQKSKAAKKERVARALALLEEQEAQ